MTQPHCCFIFDNKICLNYFLKLATIKGMNFLEVPTRHFCHHILHMGERAKFMSHGPHLFSSMDFLLKIFILKPKNFVLNVTQTILNVIRPLVKSAYQKNNFLISQPKHMLWVLKRTVSMRRFF